MRGIAIKMLTTRSVRALLRSVVILFCYCVLLTATSSAIYASDFLGSPKDCAPALKQDLLAIVKTSDQRDAWLSSIDEDTFNKITHDVQTGATFPIEGIPVTGHGNYNDFNEQRTKTLHFDSHTSSDFQSYKELRLITNDIAYASYDKCIQVYAKQHIGFTAYPVKETRDFVFIDYHYEPPHEDNPPRD
jgi:hypothetical protein